MRREKLVLIAGPCAIENKDTAFEIAERLIEITNKYKSVVDIDFIFKGSFKKANRTKWDSFSGIGDAKALDILEAVKKKFGVDILTDVHETGNMKYICNIVDYVQIPAFLCRQTDLLFEAGKYVKKGVNIKKGQFMAPGSMKHQVDKVLKSFIDNKRMVSASPDMGTDWNEVITPEIWVTERGTTFGYESLVVDYTGIPEMNKFAPVIMDCTHATQKPNTKSGVTGGNPAMIETLALCGLVSGASGLFIETHPDPSKAKSDGANMLQIDKLDEILDKVTEIRFMQEDHWVGSV